MGRAAPEPLGRMNGNLDHGEPAAGFLQHAAEQNEREHRENQDFQDTAQDTVALVEPQVFGGVDERL